MQTYHTHTHTHTHNTHLCVNTCAGLQQPSSRANQLHRTAKPHTLNLPHTPPFQSCAGLQEPSSSTTQLHRTAKPQTCKRTSHTPLSIKTCAELQQPSSSAIHLHRTATAQYASSTTQSPHPHPKVCNASFSTRYVRFGQNYRCGVGQNRIYTPYVTVYLLISLPKLPYIHCVYMVLANPT